MKKIATALGTAGETGAHNGLWVKRGLLAGVITLGALAVSGIVVAERHHRPAGPDAFLNYQVDSTSELVAALQSDPALRRRYARHFGVSEARIIDFVKNALVPYRLPQARTVTTYGVTKAGRIYAVRTQLPRGTRVWATRSGEPVLKWLCANPLTKTLPGTRLAGKPRLSKPRPVGRGLAAPGPLATNGVIIPLEEVPPVPAAPPTPVATVTSSGTPGGTLVTTNSAPPTGARPGNGLWLPFGLAAGFALLQSPGSQSSVGGNEVPPTQPPTQPPLTPPPGGTPPGTTPTTPVVTPELPGGTVPGTPVGPVIPGPGTPGIPVNPEVPLLPNTPNTPGVPEIPGIPETLPVPEPSEWLAMGMAGTSVMGLMVRARRRRSAAA